MEGRRSILLKFMFGLKVGSGSLFTRGGEKFSN
jgi:hypothetical protein